MRSQTTALLWIALVTLCGFTGAKPAAAQQQKRGNPSDIRSNDQVSGSQEANAPPKSIVDARVEAVDVDKSSITVTDCSTTIEGHCAGPTVMLSPKNLRETPLSSFRQGDHVQIDFGADRQPTRMAIRNADVTVSERSWVLAIAFLASFAVATLFTSWHPLALIVGQDNRYSNSKFQMALWFWVLIATYLATMYLRVHHAGGDFYSTVGLPPHLFLLSGMSALTFGGAKGITTAKVDAATSPNNPSPKPPGKPNIFLDFVQNDVGRFDIGDFQMLIVTLVAVGVYLAGLFHSLGLIQFVHTYQLPDVDSTILATFGLGQGAYLTKKAAGNVATS